MNAALRTGTPDAGLARVECLRASLGRSTRLLKLLANDERLLLLTQLAQAECDVGELGSALGIGQPTLSQQLAVLRRAGAVGTRRVGKHIYYHTTSADALALIEAVESLCCAQVSVA